MASYIVKVIPHAKVNRVDQNDGILKVHVTAPAQDNRANKAVIEILAAYFNVGRKQINIVQGLRSRNKIIEVF